MALSETDKQSLSAEQQAQIQALTDQWGALEAEKASASAERLAQIQQEQGNLSSQANAIRATRGYTGGADGVTVSKLPNNPATTPQTQPLHNTSPTPAQPTQYANNAQTSATPASSTKTPTTVATSSGGSTAPAKVDAQYMSADDLARVAYYEQIYNSTDDPAVKQACHEAVEDIRAKYGYSGGEDGTQITTNIGYQPTGTHHDADLSTASQAVIDGARLQYYICQANGDEAGMAYWHSVAEAERAKYGYSGGADGSEKNTVQQQQQTPSSPLISSPNTVSGVTAPGTIAGVTAPETVAGVTAPNMVSGVAAPGTIAGVTAPNTVAGTNVAGVTPTMPNFSAEELMAKWKENMPQLDPDATVNELMQGVTDPTTAKNNQIALLEQWKKEVIAQNNGLIDYNVAKAITELERALADAQPQYKEQQESVAKDERQAMDNAAFYAEVRGDKGGIGQAQYNAIQNTAAQNRLSIQQAQTKLSTDTQRQIADLRAQGEFDKADAALEVSQQYLSQLMSLEQWAMDYGLTTAQFRASLEQWAADYKMAMAQFTTGLDQWAANYDLNLAQYKTANDQWNAQFQLGQEQWNKDFAFNQQQFQTGLDQWNKEFQLGQQQFNTNVDQRNKEFQVGQQQFNTGVDQWNKNFQYSQQQDQTALEQWNKEFQLGQDQWNAQFQYAQQQDDTAYLQWLQELAYKKEQDKIANDQWQQTFDTNNSQWQQSQLASTGEVLLSAGIMPSASQLAAMNMSAAQAQDYITAAKLAAQSGSGTTGSGSGSGSGAQDYDSLFADAKASGNPQSYISNNYKSYGFASSSGLYADYKSWVDDGSSSVAVKDMNANQIYQFLLDAGYTDSSDSDEMAVDLRSRGVDEDLARRYVGLYQSSKYKALKSEQIEQYASIAEKTIPENIRNTFKADWASTGGHVTSPGIWNAMVTEYGEDAVRGLGLKPIDEIEPSAAAKSKYTALANQYKNTTLSADKAVETLLENIDFLRDKPGINDEDILWLLYQFGLI